MRPTSDRKEGPGLVPSKGLQAVAATTSRMLERTLARSSRPVCTGRQSLGSLPKLLASRFSTRLPNLSAYQSSLQVLLYFSC